MDYFMLRTNGVGHITQLTTREGTLFFTGGGMGLGVVASTCMKLFRIAASVFTGASDGTDFIKNALLNKMERRIDFIQKFLEAEKNKKTDPPIAAEQHLERG
jgi:hypothetical protein